MLYAWGCTLRGPDGEAVLPRAGYAAGRDAWLPVIDHWMREVGVLGCACNTCNLAGQ